MRNEKPRASDAPLTMEAETVPPPAEPTQVDLEVPNVPDAPIAPTEDELKPISG